MSLHGAGRQSPADASDHEAWISLPGGRVYRPSVSRPRAPSTDSIDSRGTSRRGSIERPTVLKDTSTEGSLRPFDLREPLHLFAKRMTAGPVRAHSLPVARRFAPRRALRLSLDAPPRCFKSASTTDVCSRAPAQKHPLWRPPAERRRETPPAFCFEILLETRRCRRRSRKTPDHLAVIRPPTAPCFDGTAPASDWQAVARALSRRAGRAEQLFRLRHASPAEPSGAPGTIEKSNA